MFTADQEVLDLVDAFRRRTLSHSEWTHAAHLTVALVHCLEDKVDVAKSKITDGILRLNEAQGIANTDTSGYHETLTVFWIAKVNESITLANRQQPLFAIANELIEKFSDSKVPLSYYSHERLFSMEARKVFIEPDLKDFQTMIREEPRREVVNQIKLVEVNDDRTREAAKELIREYLEWFCAIAFENYGLTFDTDSMVASDMGDPHKFHAPGGRFYVVVDGEEFVGVGCLKRLDENRAEVQRMYVRPSARGLGVGRQILDRLIEEARAIGYKSLRLESLNLLTSAHNLYRSAGFEEIPPYGAHDMLNYQSAESVEKFEANTLFMELKI